MPTTSATVPADIIMKRYSEMIFSIFFASSGSVLAFADVDCAVADVTVVAAVGLVVVTI